MSTLLLYLLKVAIINAVMLGVYYFAIRPGRNFRLMRAVLVMSIIASVLLPLLPQLFISQENNLLPVYVISMPETAVNAVTITSEPPNTLFPPLQNLLYYSVAVFLLVGMALSIFSVFKKYRKSTRKQTIYGNVMLDDSSESPFSFFKWVFISTQSLLHPDAHLLLRHEFSHVKHWHSLDRIIAGLFRALFWFSPFAHFNNRLLSEVHEYQADADAIVNAAPEADYTRLIISFSGITMNSSLTNPFSAHLKKRIAMLNYLKPGKLSFHRIAAGLVVISAVTILSAMVKPGPDIAEKIQGITNFLPSDDTSKKAIVNQKEVNETGPVFTVVENAPEFTGGDEARIAYMQKNITYPELARKNKVEGIVFVTFVIEKDGQVSNAMILRGIGGGCDEVALKAIQNMPAWIPGKQKGKPVRVQFNMPIKFNLGDKEKSKVIEETPKDRNYTEPQETMNAEDQVYRVVEQSPEFIGGMDAVVAYMQKSITYTEEAKKAGLEGTIYVAFVIEKDGSVSNAKVLRGLGGGLDEIALKTIKNMPAWEPGKQNGKAVRVQFNMPVKFSLSDGKSEKTKDLPKSSMIGGREIFNVPDVAPAFPGGQNALLDYLTNASGLNIKFTDKWDEATNTVLLIIEPDGKISDITTLTKPGLSDTDLRKALNKMPIWNPGKNKGEAVPVKIRLQMIIK